MSNGGLRTVVAALAAAAIGVVLPGPAQAAPGDPTAGYAGGGAVSARFPTALLAAPGGDVYAATGHEYSNRILLARLTPTGLDSSFGTDVSSSPAGSSLVVEMDPSGLARQADGKFVIAGSAGSNLVVVRTTPDGTALDTTFDGDGKATVAVPAGTSLTSGKVAVGTTGRIMVGAAERTNSGGSVTVYAFGPGGKLDKTFGTQGRAVAFGGAGKTIAGLGSWYLGQGSVPSVSITSNGRILTSAGVCDVPPATVDGPCSVAVVRLTGKGAPDPAFAGDGRIDVPVAAAPTRFGFYDMHALPGGHILVVTGNDATEVLARIRPDGTFNPSFGAAGVKTVPGVGRTIASSVQADGKILTLSNYEFYFETDYQESWPVLRRWNWNGTRDNTFGQTHTIPPDYVPTYGQPIGKAVLAPGPVTAMIVGTDTTATVVSADIGEHYRAWYTSRYDL